MFTPIISETAEEKILDCRHCQHSVDVRGMTQIVCLAFLTVRQRVESTACAEFEVKQIKRRASTPVLENVERV